MTVSRETRPAIVSRETVLDDVSRETYERLEAYVTLLESWNRRINLVGRCSRAELWSRHVADSLQLVRLMPAGLNAFADLGSGAGFPGLVLAIATGVHAHLVEADQRKAAFLREAARITGASVTVHAQRIETVALRGMRLVTARALAPLTQLLEWSALILHPDGICLFLKGARAEMEVAAAATAWTMAIERHISLTDRTGVILRLSEVKRVG